MLKPSVMIAKNSRLLTLVGYVNDVAVTIDFDYSINPFNHIGKLHGLECCIYSKNLLYGRYLRK